MHCFFFFFQAEDGIRDVAVTGVQTCALPISISSAASEPPRAAPCSSRAPRRGSVCTCRATARSSSSRLPAGRANEWPGPRSEEHTSELQSRLHLVCRLLLEKKNKQFVATPRR